MYGEFSLVKLFCKQFNEFLILIWIPLIAFLLILILIFFFLTFPLFLFKIPRHKILFHLDWINFFLKKREREREREEEEEEEEEEEGVKRLLAGVFLGERERDECDNANFLPHLQTLLHLPYSHLHFSQNQPLATNTTSNGLQSISQCPPWFSRSGRFPRFFGGSPPFNSFTYFLCVLISLNWPLC